MEMTEKEEVNKKQRVWGLCQSKQVLGDSVQY